MARIVVSIQSKSFISREKKANWKGFQVSSIEQLIQSAIENHNNNLIHTFYDTYSISTRYWQKPLPTEVE